MKKEKSFLQDSTRIGKILKAVPKIWDGKKSILEMKKQKFAHWKQMEWIGFYFQFLCEKYLKDFMKIPGPKYDNVRFDGYIDLLQNNPFCCNLRFRLQKAQSSSA
jgi:hypothetical protein